MSRFRNFALWCRLGRTNEQGRLEAGRVALDVRGWIGKGRAEVLPDSEYDHSLRPPRPKIAHTPPVFTQRHRLATCRFVDRSETDENCEGERKERERERGRMKDERRNRRTQRERKTDMEDFGGAKRAVEG